MAFHLSRRRCRGGGRLRGCSGKARFQLSRCSLFIAAVLRFTQGAELVCQHLRCRLLPRRIFFSAGIFAIARHSRAFARDHSSDLHQREKHRGDGGDLNSAKAHKIDKQLYESASLRDAIAKTGEHPLLESRIWFFLGEGFFQHFVHDFVLLMSLSARGAIDDMRVKRAAFILGKLAVNIGGEPVIDFVVNGCHTFSPLRRERDEAVYASTRGRGREFRAARHWSGPRYFRWCDNPSLRSNAG